MHVTWHKLWPTNLVHKSRLPSNMDPLSHLLPYGSRPASPSCHPDVSKLLPALYHASVFHLVFFGQITFVILMQLGIVDSFKFSFVFITWNSIPQHEALSPTFLALICLHKVQKLGYCPPPPCIYKYGTFL